MFAKAKSIEADRDRALRKDPYFDLAQALLQIAIVLASVAIIAGTDLLFFLSSRRRRPRRAADVKRLHAGAGYSGDRLSSSTESPAMARSKSGLSPSA